MTDKPLDCVGTTTNVGKHDFKRFQPPDSLVGALQNNVHVESVKIFASGSVSPQLEQVTQRISEIAMEAAKDYIAENGGFIGPTGGEYDQTAFVVHNPKAFMAAIGHAVLNAKK